MESGNIDKNNLLTSEAAHVPPGTGATTKHNHMNVPFVASTSTTSDYATEVIEARVIDTSETMLRLASSLSLAQKQSTKLNINQYARHQSGSRQLMKWIHKTVWNQPSFANWNGTSPEATHFEPVASQSHAEASLPPQMTVEKARNVIGQVGVATKPLNLHL
ncbi:hypothetical protein CK203_051125 [Vitis vinifera]|uniref:Uncharacterized protein n=1 Tax=Vitis vinifera TaxID=29760 RepID=A0A438FVY8_VITVI|nr:hypothetical protein CK203_051125 [Vitis vinifera]